MPSSRHAAFGPSGGISPDDSAEPVSAEPGIITEVDEDVSLERAIGAERGPTAPARLVALVRALPRELDTQPAARIRVTPVEFSRYRDEAQFSETIITELDEAGPRQVEMITELGATTDGIKSVPCFTS